jgi:hypothetical protein
MIDQFEPIEAEKIQESGGATTQSNDFVLTNHIVMLNEIRSWGFVLLGLGILHIFSSGFLSAPWGILLIIVGLASFFFRTASMFIVYAMTLAWAALFNLTDLNTGWVIFAFIQILLSFRVFMRYRRFRKVEDAVLGLAPDNLVASKSTDRASRFFPWIGSLLGCSSIIGFVLFIFILLIIAIFSENSPSFPDYFVFIEGLLVNLAVLGFAIGLASLLSQYRPKALAIIGLVAGVLTLVIELALRFL